MSMHPETDPKYQREARRMGLRYAVLFLSGLLVLQLLVYLYYSSTINRDLLSEQDREVKGMYRNLESYLERSVGHDLRYLSDPALALPALERAKRSTQGGDPLLDAIALANPQYDQVRLLDSLGHERIRVDRLRDGAIRTIPHPDLQYKGDRYYFTDAMALPATEIFVSPMDLNIERGKIEQPLKPMVRFAQKVLDSTGTPRALAVINLRAQLLLNELQQANMHRGDRVYLLNGEGWYLLGPDSNSGFGFQLRERSLQSFAHDFPQVWQGLRSNDSLIMHTGDGLFHVISYHPLGRSDAWHLVMHVPAHVVNSYYQDLRWGMVLIFVLLGTFLAWIGFSLGKSRAVHQHMVNRLIEQATLDPLTGLLNRREITRQLEVRMAMAKRQQTSLAVVFIDVDNLKKVNDTQGHEAGDRMITGLVDVLRRELRTTDLASRLGGDEFLLVLPECGREDVVTTMTRVEAGFRRQGENANSFQWTLSWGSAQFREDSETLDTLISRADARMYANKQERKSKDH